MAAGPSGLSVFLSANTAVDLDAAVAANPGLYLFGYNIRETKAIAAVATVRIVNGATGNAAGVVAQLELLADSEKTVMFGNHGIPCPLGLSIDVLAGEVTVILYYKILE
jgi:hypothetical protein